MKGLHDYHAEMWKCSRCGFCQATCPTYEVLRHESSTARGRVQLLRAVDEGRLPLSEGVAARIFNCLDCEACAVTCPSGVPTGEIFLAGKRALARAGFLPAPLRELQERLARSRNLTGEASDARLLWAEDMPLPPRQGPRAEVVYFIGCVASLYPGVYGIPRSLSRIMQEAEVDFVTLGGEEWCCGYPLLEAGLEAEDFVVHNLEVVRALDARYVVMSCPSCYYTWKNHYYPLEGVEVLHAVQFLLRLLKEGRIAPQGEFARRVTYHDPCDLGRKSGLFEEPREILARIPGLTMVEMEAHRANALCCGGGGNLESVDAGLSAAVAARRLAQAKAVGAEVIVTACQQCKRTLMGAVRRERAHIEVLDVVELVWQAMGGGS